MMFAFVTLFALAALGQGGGGVGYGGMTSSSISANGRTATGTAGFPGPRPFPLPDIAGAPYSAEQVSEHVQTLSDGTHITSSTPGQRMYRDSQGRTRTERSMMMRADGPKMPIVVEISDPVAGVSYSYLIGVEEKIAHRVTFPPAGTQPAHPVVRTAPATPPPGSGVAGGIVGSPAAVAGMIPRVQPSSESLGTQMIEGILAEGHRTTMTWPVGSQGNDRPLTDTNESWFSPDLKLMVLTKNTSLRNGESTMKLVNINRADPDPALFLPPPDYQIVDETGPFQIHWTLNQQ